MSTDPVAQAWMNEDQTRGAGEQRRPANPARDHVPANGFALLVKPERDLATHLCLSSTTWWRSTLAKLQCATQLGR